MTGPATHTWGALCGRSGGTLCSFYRGSSLKCLFGLCSLISREKGELAEVTARLTKSLQCHSHGAGGTRRHLPSKRKVPPGLGPAMTQGPNPSGQRFGGLAPAWATAPEAQQGRLRWTAFEQLSGPNKDSVRQYSYALKHEPWRREDS